jgi:hypothetical protein
MTDDLLTTPFDTRTARAYIRYFRSYVLPGCDRVYTNDKRRIMLDDMSDEDALFVAEQFATMEVEAAQRRRMRDS